MLECSSELALLSVHSCHGKSCGNTGYHTNYFAYVKIRSCGCHSDICCDGAHSSNTVNWLGAAVKCRDRLACVETPDILCCCHDNGCSSMCITHQCSSCGRAGLRWICLNEWHEVEHVNGYKLYVI